MRYEVGLGSYRFLLVKLFLALLSTLYSLSHISSGLFAVARKTFWDLGSYDEEMDVWGGENLEMSFRIWQCGGVLETIPCSRVGHIFRSFHPYSFPGNKDTHGINTARTVEVWMEEYKRLFYMNRPDLLNSEIGESSEFSLQISQQNLVVFQEVWREDFNSKKSSNVNLFPGSWNTSTLRNLFWMIPNKCLPTEG